MVNLFLCFVLFVGMFCASTAFSFNVLTLLRSESTVEVQLGSSFILTVEGHVAHVNKITICFTVAIQRWGVNTLETAPTLSFCLFKALCVLPSRIYARLV